MPDNPPNPPVNPDNLDAILPPPPAQEMPTMLGFICIVGLVLYPITFFQLLFPDPSAADLGAVATAGPAYRYPLFAIYTLKAVAYANLLRMKRWAVWLMLLASAVKLVFFARIGAPLFSAERPDGGFYPGPMIMDAIVLFNVLAYRHRMK